MPSNQGSDFKNKCITWKNYEIYTKWFDEFISEFTNFHYIYIKTKATTALERVNKRSRVGESIPLEYLQECDKYHNEWLNNQTNVLVLDGNVDRSDYSYIDWIEIINKTIFNKE